MVSISPDLRRSGSGKKELNLFLGQREEALWDSDEK